MVSGDRFHFDKHQPPDYLFVLAQKM